MKNRRTLIVVFMLVACMCIGVGFAAISQTLNIAGTGSISASAAEDLFDGQVYFTGAKDPVNCTADIAAGEKPDSATITITNTLGVVGDQATATFTITNEGNADATIAIRATNSEHFSITSDAATYTITADGSVDVKVTVTLLDTVEVDLTESGFGLELIATSAT